MKKYRLQACLPAFEREAQQAAGIFLKNLESGLPLIHRHILSVR